VPKGGFSLEGGLDASGMRLAVVVARFNAHVTGPLYDGCREELGAHGLDLDTLKTVEVPGCFELPIVAQALAESADYEGVICIGAVIRGETPHFEYVAGEAARGIQQVGLETGVPVIFGVLTTDNEQQALDRIGGSEGHKGREFALTAIEIVQTLRDLRD
jgi:6,7-dimethyl-8-ribityllumazine synthase